VGTSLNATSVLAVLILRLCCGSCGMCTSFFVCFRMFHCLFAVALFASTKLSFSFCPVITGIGDRRWVFYPVFIKATQPGHPLKSGTMSTRDRFRHRWGRNGEFCVAVGPVTRTAGILAHAGLIGSNPRRLKGKRETSLKFIFVSQEIAHF